MAYGILELPIKNKALYKRINEELWNHYQYHIRVVKVTNSLLQMAFNDKRYKKANSQLKFLHNKQTQNLPKAFKKKDATDLLKQVTKDYHLSKFDLQKFFKDIRNKHYSNTQQVVAEVLVGNTAAGVDTILYGKCATKRRRNRKLRWSKFKDFSISSRRRSYKKLSKNTYGISWAKGFVIPVTVTSDYDREIMENRKIKNFRIIQKNFGDTAKYYMQLNYEGLPPMKERTIGEGTVGIDMGPSQFALSSDKEVRFQTLFPDSYQNKIDKVSHRMNELLANNNVGVMMTFDYNPETGKHDKVNMAIHRGTKLKFSRSYKHQANKLRTLHRKQASARKHSFEKAANEIIALGDQIKLEQLSYKAWQKSGKLSRSVQNHAPGMFVEILKRKLAYWEKELQEINTWKAKLSQYNHLIGEFHKPELNDRDKQIGDYVVQRDMYSAFLAQHVGQDDIHVEDVADKFEQFIKLQAEATKQALSREGTRFGNFGKQGERYIQQAQSAIQAPESEMLSV